MKVITNIALKNNRKNRTRSILVIISILLTTILLTVISCFAYGMIKSQKVNAEAIYGSWYGALNGVTEDDISEINKRGEFKNIGRAAYAAEVMSDGNLNLYFFDETARSLTNTDDRLKRGRFPESVNEIAASEEFFAVAGYDNVQTGDTVILSSRADLNSKYEEEEFVVCGILTENDTEVNTDTYSALISEEYLKNKVLEENQSYIAYFQVNDSVEMTTDSAEEVIKELAVKCGIPEDRVSINNYYILWQLDPGIETISTCAIIAIMVIVFSAVVIYNIFQIGLVQKIREYGKLKAIGTTGRQLRKIVFREGMSLAAVGIPLGALLGYFIAEGTYTWLIDQSNSINVAQYETVSLLNILPISVAILLSVLTVWLALKKPMRIAAGISPVEAMRYQEDIKGKHSVRKRKDTGVAGLIRAGLAQNRKRNVATILTMGVSCVLFIAIANFIGNIDNEYDARKEVEHGQFEISLDYRLRDTAYPENNLENILLDNPINEDVIEKIKAIDGVTEVKTRKIFLVYDENGNKQTCAVFDREDFDNELTQSKILGDLDYDIAGENGGFIYGWAHFFDENGYSLGDTMKIAVSDGTQNVDIRVPVIGAVGSIDQDWLITEEAYNKLGLSSETYGYIWVDCAEKDRERISGEISELFLDEEHIDITEYSEVLETSRLSTRMVRLTSYAFLIIIGVIGFMNMANTMITSVITRRQEYSMLQAVGMTKRQLNIMLQAEGMVFTVGTVLSASVIGIPLGYALFKYGKANGFMGLNVWHFPLLEVVCMIAVIAVMQIILSFILTRNVKKESIVDRIRYNG